MDQPQRHRDTELDQIKKITERIVITDLGVTRKRLGLLINFNSRLLKDGVQRIIRRAFYVARRRKRRAGRLPLVNLWVSVAFCSVRA